MLFDQATITVRGGNGGDGMVGFRREKYIPYGGPNGGNGGGGGNIVLRATEGANTLVAFNRRRHFRAGDGENGATQNRQGRTGDDLIVDVPVGTVVHDKATGRILADLTRDGQTVVVARGGRGGRGNAAFKSSTRQTPRFAEKGEPGDERELALELKLIADVGLLGKPNAGKSTLLSRVSAARPKIADYPFTTLSPMLGVVDVAGSGFVMADIPGLIEGAAEGAGLGLEFLRHVERTRLLVHLIDGAAIDPLGDYTAINEELAAYNERLANKPQIVVVNKMDIPEVRELYDDLRRELRVLIAARDSAARDSAAQDGAAQDSAGEETPEVLAISAVTGEGLQELLYAIDARLQALPAEEPAEDLMVYRPHERESTEVTITRLEPDVYRLAGEEVERLALMTDWNNEESVERFERILVARGISARLEEAGVGLGDTVLIGDIELEWR